MTNMPFTQVRSQAIPRRRLNFLGFDRWLLILVAVMVGLGLVMVYSASWDVSWRLYQDPGALVRRQVLHLALGLAAMGFAAYFPVGWLRKLALPVIVFALVSLVVLLLVGAGGGPKRAFLGGSIQPSELAKLALIIYLAVWMESKGERLSDWGHGVLPLIMIIGLVGGLVLLQPDLSAVLTVAIVAWVMFYLAGARIGHTVAISLGSALVGYFLVRLTTTGQQRWSDYVAGLVNIKEASYHVQHSLQAFFSGGFLGRGLGASREKFGLLPAPHTDSIYAVVGEELGLLGALLVLCLFCLFVWRGFRIAVESPDRLSMLVACGISFWIGFEGLVNMAVLLGLLPFAGNALPFFSYGGSSLVVTLVGVGLILNISRRKPIEAARKAHVAAIGVSRRDGRGRVSRLGRGRRARRTS